MVRGHIPSWQPALVATPPVVKGAALQVKMEGEMQAYSAFYNDGS